MTTAIAVIPDQVALLPALPAADIDRAASYAKKDKSPATRAAYRSDFCLSRGVASLPATPETVAAYLASEAETGLKPSTISRRCAAIRYARNSLTMSRPPIPRRSRRRSGASAGRSGLRPSARRPPSLKSCVRWPMPPRWALRACEIALCFCWVLVGPSGAPNSWR
jgi:hypothetical protein